MIPELGHLALILALIFSLAQTFAPMWGVRQQSAVLMHVSVPLTLMVFLLTFVSFVFLEISFLQDDFSLVYAANNSNSLLPWYYKFSAVWGAHEGSMLLWALVLVGWSLAVAVFSGNLPAEVRAIVLSVQGALAVGFFLFILLTSNPFDRMLPFPAAEGSDLNPLLQDFGLIVHPPLLYMGYVGLSVAFSFAVAALILGRLDAEWARWLRPWTNVAWAFLTGGIALGSWWAYYELGWGGWWFWDQWRTRP
jgi:cytochrome c-type biogenesis protein CcmF